MKKFFFVVLLSFISLHAQSNTAEKNLLTLKHEAFDLNSSNNSDFNLSFQQEEQEQFKKKNVGLAIVYSLLLPGMGELYADSYSSGKYFTIADAALWGVYIGMNTYGNWKKDRYIAFAQSNGGVDPAGKNDEYFGNISQYQNVQAYNNEKALERDFLNMYDEEKYYWNWTEEERKSYRSMWVSSEQSFNNVRFVVGGLILNRIVSAINAVRLVSAYNKRGTADMSWNISAGVNYNHSIPDGVNLSFVTSF